MRKGIVVVCIACLVFAATLVSVQAVNSIDIMQQCKAMGDALATQIGITADQQSQIDAATSALHASAKQVWESNLPQDEKIAKIQSLGDNCVSTIMSILTPEQEKKSIEAVSMLLNLAKSSDGINIPKSEVIGGMQKMGLTANQAEGILNILAAHAQKAHSTTAATPSEKAARLWDLRMQACEEIKTVLTSDQQTVFTALIKSAFSSYDKVKSQLAADQKPKLDALANQFFSFVEEKVNII